MLAGTLFILLSLKKGKWQGFRVFTATVIALIITLLCRHKLGEFIVHRLSFVEIELITMMEQNGMGGLTMLKALSDTMTGIASYIVAPILFIILFWIVYLLFKIFLLKKPVFFIEKWIPKSLKELKLSPKLKSLLGGVFSFVIVLAAVIFSPSANLFSESGDWLRLVNIVSTAVGENTVEPLLSNADFIVGHVFETDFIVASDEERLELINRFVMSMARNYGFSDQEAQALQYAEKEKLLAEVPVLLSIYETVSSGLSDTSTAVSPEEAAISIPSPEDMAGWDIADFDAYISSLTDNLYSLQASDTVIRIVIEELVHTAIGNDTFAYPAGVPTPSVEEMKKLLAIIQEVLSEKKDLYTAVREVTAEELLPIGVITELQSLY
jgi:hypothetical protein